MPLSHGEMGGGGWMGFDIHSPNIICIHELCSETVKLEAVRGVLEPLNEVCGRYILNCTDSEGQTLLHYACSRGHLDMVRVLADKELKADLTIKDRTGDTPLALAAFNGHEDIVHVLQGC